MTEKLQQAIKDEIAQLPKEMQEAIGAVDWVKIAEEIGTENGLGQEEIEDFQLETLLVLIGAVDPKFYAINIENQANQITEKAEKVASEALEKIFSPIAKTLEENVKKNLKNKRPNPEQTLNFIMSGGNYSAFVGARTNNSSGAPSKPVNPPSLKEIKDKLVI